MSNKEVKEKKVYDKRAKSLKLFSVGSVVLLLVIILVANILFDQILGDTLTFDFSSTSQNSISEQTQEYLDSLPADTNIRIVGLMDEPSSSAIKDTPYEYIVPLLDDYVAKSDGKVTVEYINPSTYPTIISELDPQGVYDLSADTYAIEYNGKIKVITPINLFTYDSESLQSGYYVPTSNNVENNFTNAMLNLTTAVHKKAYFVTGLENTDEHEQLSTLLDALVVDSEDLPASDYFEVPDDCDLLVMSGINQDITESMLVAITDYLEDNGKLLVSMNFSTDNAQTDLTNLNELLNRMNISIGSSLLIEGNSNYQISNSRVMTGTYSIVTPTDDYSSFVGSASTACTCYAARPISESGNPEPYIEAAPVLTTSDSATTGTVDSDGYVTTSGNNSTLNVAMYSTFTGTDTKVYVFGTETFTADQWLSQSLTSSNATVMKSVLSDLIGSGSGIDVPTKALSDYSFDTEKSTGNYVTIMSIILMAVIPLVFIIIGVVVYKKRKNL